MKHLFLCVLIISALFLAACGGGSGSSSVTGGSVSTAPSGTVYVTGSDAPLPSVLAFQITINSMALSNATTSVPVISEPTSVEFSRLLGLRTLLALNSVPAGTYNKVSVTFASPVISYLDINTSPASVGIINGTLANSTINLNLPQPLTVGENGLGGMHFHINLRDSLGVDSVSGELTGTVDPKIQMRPLTVNDDDAEIDELRGGLSSVDVAHNSFVIQRFRGRDVTIRVDSNTSWDGTDNINTLSLPAIIEVSGKVQADGSVLADQVQVITRDRSFVAGLVLGAQPPVGSADSFSILVREEMPVIPGVDVGKPATLTIGTPTRFDIYTMHLPVETFLFNRSQLVVGQRVSVGGVADTSTTPATFTTRRVVLHRQGMDGVYSPNSLVVTAGNTGEFKLVENGFFGYLFGAPVRVITSPATRFINLTGLSDVANSGNSPIFVVGLLLKDDNGNPVLVAGKVGKSNTAN